ncbi:MAG: penicillin acylase family protein [Betaproteobacteria bacterium]|nr:penicillin acylase family protein [Betaproteobacteria bacterium]
MTTILRTFVLRACVLLFALAPSAVLAGWSMIDVDGERVDVFRDEFGRPHIFAATNRGLFTAYGYAVAEDRLWQLELNRRVARGRLAEILGTGFPVLSDSFVRTTGYTDAELDAQFAALDPGDQAAYRAYIDGINRYLAFAAENPSARLPFEFLVLGLLAPEPWTARDTTAFAAFMARRFGEIGGAELDNKALLDALVVAHGAAAGLGVFNDVRWLIDPDSPATIPESGALGPRQHVPRAPHASQLQALPGFFAGSGEAQLRRHWESLGVPSRLGSYAWIVSPQKSAHGYAMLYGGPQMGFAVPEVMHEVQLKSDEGFNVTGMAIAGMPYVIIGRNRHVAWSFTTGLANDNLDTYVETLCGAGGTVFQAECRPLAVRSETIQVARSTPVTLVVARSVHGPVVGMSGPLAFTQKRAHWMTELASVARLSGMNRAQNLGEFERHVLEITVAFNVHYADQRGNIAYWFGGRNPVRAAGFDPRLPLPGDGSAEWTGAYLPVPKSINPEQGWLANWNNRPTRDYPGNEASFGKMNRASDLFRRLRSGPISLDDMRDIPKDIARVKATVGRESPSLQPYLNSALGAVPPAHPQAAAARAVLAAWDGSAFADAVTSTTLQAGEVIFSTWLARVLDNTFGDELGANLPSAGANMLLHALDDALGGGSSVPPSRDYFNGVSPHSVLSASFDEALAALTAAQGPEPSAWTAPRGSIVFSHPLLGTVASIPLSNRATYGQIVQLKTPRPEGENIFSLGQSGRIVLGPSGPVFDAHFFDQLPHYAAFEYKPMPLYLNKQLKE